MKNTLMLGLATGAVALFALTGCTAAKDTGANEKPPASTSESAPPAEAELTLSTAEADLGTIIVDGDGMTVYQFDKDTVGGDGSSCTDECSQKWPAVPGEDAELDGVEGEIGTITGVDGKPQLTLNGWPLYYFAGDTAAGDTNGQSLMGAWWVLSPEGEPIH